MRYLLGGMDSTLDLWLRTGAFNPLRTATALTTIGFLLGQTELCGLSPILVTSRCSAPGNSERQHALGSGRRGGLTVLEVPAGHDDMALPPHSKLLAEYFDALPRCRCTRRVNFVNRRLDQ